MGDFLGSLTKPHIFVVQWLNCGQYRLEKDQGSPVEGLRPYPVGGVTVVSEPVLNRKCANEYVGPLKGVDCDDLSGRV